MRSDNAQEAGADPRHAVETAQLREGTMGLAVGHDGLGECQADAREAGQLLRGSAVGIDALVGTERASECENAVTMRDG
jgi:hypothetical protein